MAHERCRRTAERSVLHVRHHLHEPPQLLDAEEAWERAYKHALTTPLWQHAQWLLDTIGPRFTAAAVGVTDARTVRRWRDEQTEPRDHTEEQARLQLLFRIAPTRSPSSTAAAPSRPASCARPTHNWTTKHPWSCSPSSDPDQVQRALLTATRAFLEG